MSRLCGHPLASNRICQHLVADPTQPDCGRHRAGTSQPSQLPVPRLDRRGCRMQEQPPGAWRCLVHSGPEWAAARALGATLPCRIPLSATARRRLAKNSSNPGTLRLLAEDPDEGVRWKVARNPNTPASALARLAEDPEAIMRQAAQERRRP